MRGPGEAAPRLRAPVPGAQQELDSRVTPPAPFLWLRDGFAIRSLFFAMWTGRSQPQ